MRFVLNMLIKTVVLWFFSEVTGWFKITHILALTADPQINKLIVLGILALFWAILSYIIWIVWGIGSFATLGIGCILFPLVLLANGPIVFWGLAHLLPGWVDTRLLTTFQMVIIGVTMTLITIPEVSLTSSSR